MELYAKLGSVENIPFYLRIKGGAVIQFSPLSAPSIWYESLIDEGITDVNVPEDGHHYTSHAN